MLHGSAPVDGISAEEQLGRRRYLVGRLRGVRARIREDFVPRF